MRRTILLACLAAVACDTADSGADTVTLALDPFVVQPGEEGLRCQTFANPVGGDAAIRAFAADLDRGGHHLLVWRQDGATDTPLGPCGQDPGYENLLFQSQRAGNARVELPPDAVASIPSSAGLYVQIHYLNSGSEPVTIANRLSLELAGDGEAAALSALFFDNLSIRVPAGSTGTVIEKSCPIDRDADLVWVSSHMHSHGLDFTIRSGDELIYRTDTADGPPMQVFDPPVHLARGSEVTYACTYRGEPDRDITFGPSLADDAMCSMVGGWLPAGGAEPGLLGCADGECLTCFEAIVRQAPDEVCDDQRAALEAYQTCACQDTCADACGATACAGQMPDDGCRACIDTSCAAESEACLGGG
jgi:hypothetical protein